ncbi:MAG: response regulator, partial [Syntrophobacter sp.]
MPRILLVSTRSEGLAPFTRALSSDSEVQLRQVEGHAEAIDEVRELSPHLVIIDAGLPDADRLEFVRELWQVDAMVNTAVISTLTHEQFHEAS